MAVKIKMGLERLPFVLRQREGILPEGYPQLVRPGLDKNTGLEMPVHRAVIPPVGREIYGEALRHLIIEQYLHFVGFPQPFHVLVPVPHEPDLDFIFAILGKGVRQQGAAACAERKALDVLFLGIVCRHAEAVSTRFITGSAHGQAAHLLSGGNIAIQQTGR